ncbi:hypothetical protein HELRODRAFT_165734 [Helobdella robusta]|uniref:Uncharacterized protein n=1 Tax=Helobdella robusta TaxID=6412 RepID=T1EX82_HELRO|nr:hypothetical protein HELRODRAFT_165734 [Helobdella robusta]ESN91677.1 hypothetical protein HELRODRAFT_165734 [Helobdella robusta]
MKSVGENLSRVGLSHDLIVEQRNELKKFLDDAKQVEKNSTEDFSYRARGDVGKWKIVNFLAKTLINGRLSLGYDLYGSIKRGSHGFNRNDDNNSNLNENFNLGLLNVRSIAPNVDGVYGLISDGLDVLVLTKNGLMPIHHNIGNIERRLVYCCNNY